MACRKHTPVPLFADPGPAAPVELRIAYVFRGHDRQVRCAGCDLLGFVRRCGKGVCWITPGKAGYEGRAKKLAAAREWNELVRAAETAGAACEGALR